MRRAEAGEGRRRIRRLSGGVVLLAGLTACDALVGVVAVSGVSDAAPSDGSAHHDAGDGGRPDATREAGHPDAREAGPSEAGPDGQPTVVVPYDSATPPAEPFDGATVTITSAMQTFAVRRLYLGDTTPRRPSRRARPRGRPWATTSTGSTPRPRRRRTPAPRPRRAPASSTARTASTTRSARSSSAASTGS